ncbi:hypothetical protein PG911_05575 [Tenacibaculum ovolyticum]|uniref:alkaline phosphatase family protein n=1 Tax=Tenacibaculum ovolyticum TaxID=104270 RepID=UPI0022F3ADEB|nr:alkaline phosphatase family protein [Tenacibaculum ovolyticum]WBX77729.1 hypothetical protein PG911_05575 [Tenacibaculum ovolyticum]
MEKLDSFKKVVVLMLENRSFDNLLGFLYKDGIPEGKKFEGLQGKTISNPIPKRAEGTEKNKVIEVSKAENYHQPYPDPGEEYQHVNTQLYNYISPENIGISASKMKPPYNIPKITPSTPSMNGFVNDYINTLEALPGYKTTEEEYRKIMQCFIPDKIPVLTTLAKEFAVFDHWFCSVPSQTWCNRSFWHAGTSGEKVINPNNLETAKQWIKDVWSQPTLFDRLSENQKSFTIYTEDYPITALVNGIKYCKQTEFGGLNKFKEDAIKGKLPNYSFIEPKFYGQHNDQHPSAYSTSGPSKEKKLQKKIIIPKSDTYTKEGTVLLGEKLIWDVYNAVKNSPDRDEILLIITHDEHGGCFDHVPPEVCVPPVPKNKSKSMNLSRNKEIEDTGLGFSFDRLGVRVPMVMISSFIEKNTIVNDTHDHTSFIKTMCEKWGMEGLTNRDKAAKSFASVFSNKKRIDFPDIPEPQITDINEKEYDNDKLNGLQKSIIKNLHFCVLHSIKEKSLNSDKLLNINDIDTVKKAKEYINILKLISDGMDI